eukprot:7839716-Karenia_brevis.AAC.1
MNSLSSSQNIVHYVEPDHSDHVFFAHMFCVQQFLVPYAYLPHGHHTACTNNGYFAATWHAVVGLLEMCLGLPHRSLADELFNTLNMSHWTVFLVNWLNPMYVASTIEYQITADLLHHVLPCGFIILRDRGEAVHVLPFRAPILMMEASISGGVSLSASLPHDTMMRLIKFCMSLPDLCRLAPVCMYFNNILLLPSMWGDL